MGFKLGNFNIDEVLFGIARDFDDTLLYTMDQLSSAQIEVSAESTDITDKKGNVVRTIYTSKTATLSATNAFLHPQIMNASSGSSILEASNEAPIQMPFVATVTAGTGYALPANYVTTTLQVVGLFGNGANGSTYGYSDLGEYISASGGVDTLTMPAASGEDTPNSYVIYLERSVKTGIRLVNDAYTFPNAIQLTLYCSYVDPCDDELKPCYVYLPNFTPDPNVTISLDRETQEMDYNGNINVDFCSTDRVLYYIYFPGDESVKSGVAA